MWFFKKKKLSLEEELLKSIKKHKYKKVITLIKENQLQEKLFLGKTLIQLASEQNGFYLIPQMHEVGCDINQKNEDGSCPIVFAVENKATLITQALLKLNVNLDVINPNTKENLLLIAVDTNQYALSHFLLDQKIDMFDKNINDVCAFDLMSFKIQNDNRYDSEATHNFKELKRHMDCIISNKEYEYKEMEIDRSSYVKGSKL